MNTSKCIKTSQYNPGTVTKTGNGRFEAESRDGTTTYQLIRRDSRFYCNCPATGLCHHIIDLVTESASSHGYKVSFWTSQEDASRQKRRTLKYYAGYRPFWVTFKVAKSDAERIWNAPKPDIWSHGNILWERDGCAVYSHNEGLDWYYTFHATLRRFQEQVGRSFHRNMMGYTSERSFSEFEKWFDYLVKKYGKES